MAKCELSIKDTYVREWGLWECVREAMQNGLDEDDRGYSLEVTHQEGVLQIHNSGADLHVQALVLGVGDKAGQEGMRGRHCEGLALGMLAGVRNGAPVKIRTQSESWIASIEHSDVWQTKVLVVRTRKMRNYSGVTVSIPIAKELWADYRTRFLRFAEVEAISTIFGRLLTDKRHVGMLFDKGIFVEKKEDLKYGYDFTNASLDRDRKFFSEFNFQWEAANILEAATYSSPAFIKELTEVIQQDGPESRAFLLNAPGLRTREMLAEEFVSNYGEQSIPVTDGDGSRTVGALGRRGVVVPKAMVACLKGTSVPTLDEVKESSKNEVIHQYPWADLEGWEQRVFDQAIDLHTALVATFRDNDDLCRQLHISESISQLEDFPLSVCVAKFGDAHTKSWLDQKARKCLIARKEMSHTFRFLRAIIKEHTNFVRVDSTSTMEPTHNEAEMLIALAYTCEMRREKQLETDQSIVYEEDDGSGDKIAF